MVPRPTASPKPHTSSLTRDTNTKQRTAAQLFRADDRLARRQQASAELGVGVEALKSLPRAVRQAAASGSLPYVERPREIMGLAN